MSKYEYRPVGVCSQKIEFEIDNDIVKNVKFTGGCNGNSKGVGALVEGMTVEEVVSKCKGITCGYKSTSCPDQLAIALKKAKGLN